jgi:hypothetical protein
MKLFQNFSFGTGSNEIFHPNLWLLALQSLFHQSRSFGTASGTFFSKIMIYCSGVVECTTDLSTV